MRIKEQGDRAGFGLRGQLSQLLQNRLVAQVDAVKHAHGDGGALAADRGQFGRAGDDRRLECQ